MVMVVTMVVRMVVVRMEMFIMEKVVVMIFSVVSLEGVRLVVVVM